MLVGYRSEVVCLFVEKIMQKVIYQASIARDFSKYYLIYFISGYLMNLTHGGSLVRALRARAGILLLTNQRNFPPEGVRAYLPQKLRPRNSIADIGISVPSAKLIQDGNRFLGLRHFGEIYRKRKHYLYKKTLLTLMKLIYPPITPVDIKITLNYREKPTL